MDGATIVLAAAALAVNFGWQPSSEDPQAYEVLMQVEPELLDALADGEPLRIESHVPAEIAPIRNVRVVVGSADLPRTPLTNSDGQSQRVVRGQENRPLQHTARLQDNNGWADDRYRYDSTSATENSRRYEQRGAPIGDETVRTAQVPAPLGRAQSAVVETGNVLRDGIEAGIQQANQKFGDTGEQVRSGAANTGRQLGQEFQRIAGAVSQRAQSVWPAPPPAQMAPETAAGGAYSITETPSGWSSVRSDLAPPRLLNPPLVASNTPGTSSAASSRSNGTAGPSFPAGDNRSPFHSVLTDPATATGTGATQAPGGPNWAAGWGTAPTAGQSAAGGNASSAAPSLEPRVPTAKTQPVNGRSADEDARWAWPDTTSTSSNPIADNSIGDRYNPPTLTTSSNTTPDPWANLGTPSASPGGTVAGDRYPPQPGAQPAPSFAAAPPYQPGGQIAGNQTVIGVANPANSAAQSAAAASNELPWLPLLVVSVSLAASLGANLFLGWSYADARHRYRALVRKSADSFQRATGVAA